MEISGVLEDLVRREIDRLQVPPTIRGHRYLVYITGQLAADPGRIEGITKDLYRETARRFRTNWSAVERSSRVAITCCWESAAGRERFCKLAGYQFTERPSISAFTAIVAQYITENYSIAED